MNNKNIDRKVVDGFGDEWSRFDQAGLSECEHREIFDTYFSIFPWDKLPSGSTGFDMGCGSGRWAKLVALRVGRLHCIDASKEAVDVAKRNLADAGNCQFHVASVDDIPLEDCSADFGYSLGVLHHVPDTEAGIAACVSKLKEGAPFLLYLYHAFDGKPFWYRYIWKLSEGCRFFISKMPFTLRYLLSQIIALFIYWPLARFAVVLERITDNIDSFPLSYYRKRSLYVMRNDALDRFGTKLEKRFTQEDICKMMGNAGLKDISFSSVRPYWTAVGYKR